MKTDDLEKIEFSDNSRLSFNHDLSRLNWFNIGGKSQIYLLANSLKDLSLFLKNYKKRGKIYILGAGSNTLFDDDIYEGAVIKLGKNFNRLSLLEPDTIISKSENGRLGFPNSFFRVRNGRFPVRQGMFGF